MPEWIRPAQQQMYGRFIHLAGVKPGMLREGHREAVCRHVLQVNVGVGVLVVHPPHPVLLVDQLDAQHVAGAPLLQHCAHDVRRIRVDRRGRLKCRPGRWGEKGEV